MSAMGQWRTSPLYSKYGSLVTNVSTAAWHSVSRLRDALLAPGDGNLFQKRSSQAERSCNSTYKATRPYPEPRRQPVCPKKDCSAARSKKLPSRFEMDSVAIHLRQSQN